MATNDVSTDDEDVLVKEIWGKCKLCRSDDPLDVSSMTNCEKLLEMISVSSGVSIEDLRLPPITICEQCSLCALQLHSYRQLAKENNREVKALYQLYKERNNSRRKTDQNNEGQGHSSKAGQAAEGEIKQKDISDREISIADDTNQAAHQTKADVCIDGHRNTSTGELKRKSNIIAGLNKKFRHSDTDSKSAPKDAESTILTSLDQLLSDEANGNDESQLLVPSGKTDKVFICIWCHQVCNNYWLLRNHKKKHMRCKFCEHTSKTEEERDVHLKTTCPVAQNKQPPVPTPSEGNFLQVQVKEERMEEEKEEHGDVPESFKIPKQEPIDPKEETAEVDHLMVAQLPPPPPQKRIRELESASVVRPVVNGMSCLKVSDLSRHFVATFLFNKHIRKNELRDVGLQTDAKYNEIVNDECLVGLQEVLREGLKVPVYFNTGTSSLSCTYVPLKRPAPSQAHYSWAHLHCRSLPQVAKRSIKPKPAPENLMQALKKLPKLAPKPEEAPKKEIRFTQYPGVPVGGSTVVNLPNAIVQPQTTPGTSVVYVQQPANFGQGLQTVVRPNLQPVVRQNNVMQFTGFQINNISNVVRM